MVDVDVSKVKKFNYLLQDHSDFDETLLTELHCKHIIRHTEATKEVEACAERASKALNITNTLVWGYYCNGTVDSELAIIEKMVANHFMRPVRVFRDQYGREWADNTHTVISWILRLGIDAKVKDIVYYGVDLSKEIPIVYDIDNALSNSIYDTRTAIACSLRIKERIEHSYRPLNVEWRIKDLMKNMNLL